MRHFFSNSERREVARNRFVPYDVTLPSRCDIPGTIGWGISLTARTPISVLSVHPTGWHVHKSRSLMSKESGAGGKEPSLSQLTEIRFHNKTLQERCASCLDWEPLTCELLDYSVAKLSQVV